MSEFLRDVPPADLVPGADHYGPPQGNPPVAPVLSGDRVAGYAFVNADWVNSTGYSGKPIQILVGLGTDGKITGARLMDHHEPIVLIGIPPARIAAFIGGYIGKDVLQLAANGPSTRPPVDIVSGATVTVTVIAESMIRSGIRVARAKGIGGVSAAAASAPVQRELDPSATAPEDWAGLVGDGSVRRLHLSVGDVSQAFARAGNQDAADHPESPEPSDTFIDLYVAPVSVPAIGRRLLGDAGYEVLQHRLNPGQQAILFAANGLYSFKGSGYVRGGIFDRIELLQGDSGIRFRDRNHDRVSGIAAPGAPDFHDVDLFRTPEGSTLNITQPWRLQLLAERAFHARDKGFLTFDISYDLPEKYLRPVPASAAAAPAAPTVAAPGAAAPEAAEAAEAAEPPLWHMMWRAKAVDIGILSAALLVLTAIFFFQDWLVKRPVFYDRVRLGFLIFTLVWLGWYAQAQLSIVNVLAFLNALRTDFRWDYFLMAPLIFILWFATAASLLFWNRGAFCGWLCPFGALQELVNRIGRLLKIPQLRIPFGVHQRLTALKYIVFLVLFGISLSALGSAEQAAEVEPFKTAIILRFAREWPFVLYAGALLAGSLTVERVFCRYLCPLGAALAIPARLRMFDWLWRYRECGNPCQRCASECPVQAIHPEGHINPNECIQCLHCQMLYHHDQKCPVMIQRRLKREQRATMSAPPALPKLSGGHAAGLQAAKETRATPAAPPSGKAPLTILYATESGNAESLAGATDKAAQRMGIAAKTLDMADAMPEQVARAGNLLVIASTWGDGDPPQRAEPFYAALMSDTAPRFADVRFAVLALGDRAYAKFYNFCETGKRIDERLAQLGGQRIAPRVDCDIDYEKPAKKWIETSLRKLESEAGAAVIHVDFARPAASEEAHGRARPFAAEINEIINLNGSGSSTETYHLELSLEGSGVAYEPGDALGFVPTNDPALVDDVLTRAGLADDAALREALSVRFDVTTLTRDQITNYAALTGEAKLGVIAEDTAQAAEFLRDRQFIDLLEAAPHRLSGDQLTGLLRPLQPRLYSVASSRASVGEKAHLLIAVVRWESHGRVRKGVASSEIAERRKAGQQLKVHLKPNAHFRLPGDPGQPIIMIGPGTGVAPFRAFLQEREAAAAAGRNWLFFGARNLAHDFLYRLEWQAWAKSGLLSRIDLAFSRDQREKIYVQHRMWEARRELFAWLEEGAALYVCGDATAMAKDVQTTLVRIVAEESGRTEEAAADYLHGLQKSGRYLKDVY